MSEEIIGKIKEALSTVADPHMGISIVEMGIVQNIDIDENDTTVAKITIRPTNPGCMSAANIAMNAKMAAEKVDGIDKVEIVVEGHMMADAISEMVNK
ncbi:MAG: metal-sulfur cluster assembly factor [Methanobacterium sp.]|uniref:metal-sulfur cluster assembly factor n=1 Tax=Methanobacterium sp. TaxID=2164 RepID=UPI003D65B7F5|nr:metal-sulfur cluster assembly factor [Methanobacterium sp.]